MMKGIVQSLFSSPIWVWTGGKSHLYATKLFLINQCGTLKGSLLSG